MNRRPATTELVKRVLRDSYLNLIVDRYTLAEDASEGGKASVTVELHHAHEPDHTMTLEGEGVGAIDALYHALHQHYVREYPSLETLLFTGFSVKGQMETGKGNHGADAEAAVGLVVSNSEGHAFEFEASGRSLVATALRVVVMATEWFINSERAFITVYRALRDARERGRVDLVNDYTAQLAELVNTTSYSAVTERIKNEVL
ncbi:MAG: hypothetical protein H6704_12520 [Myxococcales bacterium]|nr:hypothetical protein [Myxococcales bacterium]MCB9537067.1 hypothetical protein [Myxococcales bacterium]